MIFSPNYDTAALRRSILLIHLTAGFFWAAVYIYMPILSPYTQMISGSFKSVGLVIGAYGLAQLLLRIPLGLWSDRLQKRKLFVLYGFFFDALAALGLLISANTAMLFFSVFAAGIAASMWVPFTVLFASYFPAEKLSSSMSLLLFSTRLSQITANYTGGMVAEAWDWSGPFYLGIILAAIGFLLATGLAEPGPGKATPPSLRQLLTVGKNPFLILSSLTCIILQFTVFSAPISFTPLHAQQIGASKGQLGILLFCYQLPNTAATLLSGTYLLGYFSQPLLIFSGFISIAGSLIILPLISQINILYGIQALNGFGVGLAFPLLMTLALRAVAPGQQATAMGFFQSLYALGMTAGPIISGLLAQQWGLNIVFLINALLALGSGIFFFKKIKSLLPQNNDSRKTAEN
ncbi:MAG: MFS transporter [Thermodesulfobacteriota bacterium]